MFYLQFVFIHLKLQNVWVFVFTAAVQMCVCFFYVFFIEITLGISQYKNIQRVSFWETTTYAEFLNERRIVVCVTYIHTYISMTFDRQFVKKPLKQMAKKCKFGYQNRGRLRLSRASLKIDFLMQSYKCSICLNNIIVL